MPPKFASAKKWPVKRPHAEIASPTSPSSPSSSSSSSSSSVLITSKKKRYKVTTPAIGNAWYEKEFIDNGNEEEKFKAIMEHQMYRMHIRTDESKNCIHLGQKENSLCILCGEFVNKEGKDPSFKLKMLSSSPCPTSSSSTASTQLLPTHDPNLVCDNPKCVLSNGIPSWKVSPSFISTSTTIATDEYIRILCDSCNKTSYILTMYCNPTISNSRICLNNSCPLDPLISCANDSYYCSFCSTTTTVTSLPILFNNIDSNVKSAENTGKSNDNNNDDYYYGNYFDGNDQEEEGEEGEEGRGDDDADILYFDEDEREYDEYDHIINNEEENDNDDESKSSSNQSPIMNYISCKSYKLLSTVKEAATDLCKRMNIGSQYLTDMIQKTSHSIISNMTRKYFDGKRLNVHRKTRVRFMIESFIKAALSSGYHKVVHKADIIKVLNDVPSEHIPNRIVRNHDTRIMKCLGAINAYTEDIMNRLSKMPGLSSGQLSTSEIYNLKILSSWAICAISVMNLLHPPDEIKHMAKNFIKGRSPKKFDYLKDEISEVASSILLQAELANSDGNNNNNRFFDPISWCAFVHPNVKKSIIDVVDSKSPPFPLHITGIVGSRIQAFAGGLLLFATKDRIAKARKTRDGKGPSACHHPESRRLVHKERPKINQMLSIANISKASQMTQQTIKVAMTTLILMYHIVFLGNNKYYPCYQSSSSSSSSNNATESISSSSSSSSSTTDTI